MYSSERKAIFLDSSITLFRVISFLVTGSFLFNFSLIISLSIYATPKKSSLDLIGDLDSKLNRLLYRENLTKKLLAQFFVNMGFAKNISLEKDRCYQEFLIENDKYRDGFIN